MKPLADIKSIELFLLLLVLIVPGVIIDFVRAQFVGRRTRTVGEASLNFVVVSIVYYALSAPLVLWATGGLVGLLQAPMAWYALLLVGPTSVGLVLGFVAQRDLLGRNARRLGFNVIHPMPTAWDRRFGALQESLVIITLKDGRKVAGYMGPLSVASSDPENRDIFIERIYGLEGDEWTDMGETSALIMAGEISTVEFIVPNDEPEQEAENDDEGQADNPDS